MEKQTLPNSTLILVFGILSIVGCCCYGVLGLIFGIIALFMSKKAKATYLENPEIYKGYKNVEAGRIMSIIGVILSVLYFAWFIYLLVSGRFEESMEETRRLLEQMQ